MAKFCFLIFLKPVIISGKDKTISVTYRAFSQHSFLEIVELNG